MITIPYKHFQRIEARGGPNSFSEVTIAIIPTPEKAFTRKENHRPICLMNINAKILNKVLANQIQPRIRRIVHHDQVGLNPDM